VKTIITVNGLDVKVISKKVLGNILAEKVVIIDEFNDVDTIEAELIVKYLYNEGFLKKEGVSLEVVKVKY
tara:strand:- start:8077 stop:8286 length:210 start_codon:yes stop_codon:yes gene_type:complete